MHMLFAVYIECKWLRSGISVSLIKHVKLVASYICYYTDM